MGERSLAAKKTIVRFDGKETGKFEDEVAVEYPLTVMLNGEEFATIVCSPADIEDMVIGFLASEGVMRFSKDIDSLTIDESKGYAYVEMKVKQPVPRDFYMKRMIGSCCGKGRHFYFQNDAKTAKTITGRWGIPADRCFTLMDQMQRQSFFFKKTGGVHHAALCTKDEIVAIRADIGRHNALDKLYGHCLKNRVGMADKIVVFSGRVSSEVLLKISKIGVGILLSKSAPTDLALDLAEELNITVAGFIRGESMNVYTHSWRIGEPSTIDRAQGK